MMWYFSITRTLLLYGGNGIFSRLPGMTSAKAVASAGSGSRWRFNDGWTVVASADTGAVAVAVAVTAFRIRGAYEEGEEGEEGEEEGEEEESSASGGGRDDFGGSDFWVVFWSKFPTDWCRSTGAGMAG